MTKTENLEHRACSPKVPVKTKFNKSASLPYGLTVSHIQKAMTDFVDFLGFINRQLYSQKIARLESILMPANFSSMVGEFMKAGIPKYCESLASNQYHNGHPDLVPQGRFPNNAVQHSTDGIEIKASRYMSGWQGHNPENVWLMLFAFESNRPVDSANNAEPFPFKFRKVVGALLDESDWSFSGRTGESRRTITASVLASGYAKMEANWIYKDLD